MKNKKKNLKKMFQWGMAAVAIFWLYSWAVAHLITDATSTFYKVVNATIAIGSIANIIISERWWQRVVWTIIALLFAVSLIYWIGWDMNSDIRF